MHRSFFKNGNFFANLFILVDSAFLWSTAYSLIIAKDNITIPEEPPKWFEFARFSLKGQPPPVKFTVTADFNTVYWSVTLALKPLKTKTRLLRNEGAVGVLVLDPSQGSVSILAWTGTNCSELQGSYRISTETASGVSLSKEFVIGKSRTVLKLSKLIVCS